MSEEQNGRVELRVFPDLSVFARSTAAAIGERLSAAIEARGRAALVVPGGTTPAPVFDALARTSLDWSKVTITLSDERWVDVSDPASNQRQARLRLLQGAVSLSPFVSWRGAGTDMMAAARSLNASLTPLQPFDVCVLGLGIDGHIASLIPGAVGFDDAMQDGAIVRPIHAPGAAGAAERLSLTWSAIAASRLVVLVFTGAAKRAVFDRAQQGEGASPIVRLLREAHCPVWACWAPEA